MIDPMVRASQSSMARICGVLSVSCAALVGCSGADRTVQPEPTGIAAASVTTPQSIAVPAYYWYTASDWNSVTPQNGVGLVVVNPSNGLLDTMAAADIQGFASRIQSLQALSPRPLVFGYVYTEDANTQPDTTDSRAGGTLDRTVAKVEANIDLYFQDFPSIDGIFLDQVTTDCSGGLSYYQSIYQWMQTAHAGKKVILNPGTADEASQCYLSPTRAGDIIVTFEDTYAEYVKCKSRPSWETSYPSTTIWHIIHDTPSTAMANALALSRSRNAGYVYVTDLSYSQAASYLASEGSNVLQNGGTFSTIHFSAQHDTGAGRYDFTATFDVAYSFNQVYIDSTGSGYPLGGINSEYLIENGGFYSYAGPGWAWNPDGSSNMTVNGSTYSWWVPDNLVSVTTPPVQIVFHGGNTPSDTTGICTIP